MSVSSIMNLKMLIFKFFLCFKSINIFMTDNYDVLFWKYCKLENNLLLPPPHKKMSMFHESLRCKSSLYNLLNIHKRLYTTYVSTWGKKKFIRFVCLKRHMGKNSPTSCGRLYSPIIRWLFAKVEQRFKEELRSICSC